MKSNKIKTIGNKAYHYGIQLVAVGGLTGLFVGLVCTCYNLLIKMAEEFSRGYYGFFRENPAFIPLLFLALFAGALIIGGTLRFIPMIQGSGIPQIEGAARGMLRFKWYRVLTGMFAASLFTVFMGLSAGSEGPSIHIGGSCGLGVSMMLKRSETVRRYQITGGACAGLAVAFNAPLTGMAFAFEEAYKRFTSEIFICSFSSVIIGVVTRNLLYMAFGMDIGPSFTNFVFDGFSVYNFRFYGYVIFASVICGLCGVAFYYLAFRAKKLFGKITFFKGIGKMIIPFLLAGAFGLISVNVMGGGHEFIQSLGSLSEGIERIFSSPIWLTLLLVVLMKTVLTVTNIGAGVPCGAFIPMLAIGAGLGALLSRLCLLMGMNPANQDILIMICMATFFTTIVKAPITGIVMVSELTWNFAYLLPVISGVAVGYLIGVLFKTEPIYDKLLDMILEDNRKGLTFEKLKAKVTVKEKSSADGCAVREILWPTGALVTAVERGGEVTIPDGKTVLAAGDVLFISGETSDRAEFLKTLTVLSGNEPLITSAQSVTEE